MRKRSVRYGHCHAGWCVKRSPSRTQTSSPETAGRSHSRAHARSPRPRWRAAHVLADDAASERPRRRGIRPRLARARAPRRAPPAARCVYAPAETYDDRGESAVLARPTRQRRVPGTEERQVREIRAGKAQRAALIHRQPACIGAPARSARPLFQRRDHHYLGPVVRRAHRAIVAPYRRLAAPDQMRRLRSALKSSQ